MRNKFVLVIVFALIAFVLPFAFMMKETKCDTHVVLENAEYDCRSVDSRNGMSTIKMCDGSKISVPTASIVIIKEIEDNE